MFARWSAATVLATVLAVAPAHAESVANFYKHRQVDLIVGHMLELGKKSQQVGTVLDIVAELAKPGRGAESKSAGRERSKMSSSARQRPASIRCPLPRAMAQRSEERHHAP